MSTKGIVETGLLPKGGNRGSPTPGVFRVMSKMPIMKRSVRNCGRTIAILLFVATVSGWRAFGAGGEIDRSALPPPAERKVDFWQDVEPIFRERCQNCHGPEKQMAGLRLDN